MVFVEAAAPLQETTNERQYQPTTPIKWAFSVSTDHIDEELRCYDEQFPNNVRGLALETRRTF